MLYLKVSTPKPILNGIKKEELEILPKLSKCVKAGNRRLLTTEMEDERFA